jgi:hypothetical protein
VLDNRVLINSAILVLGMSCDPLSLCTVGKVTDPSILTGTGFDVADVIFLPSNLTDTTILFRYAY